MNRKKQRIREYVGWTAIALVIACIMLAISEKVEEYTLQKIIGGIPSSEGELVRLLPMGLWLLLISLFILVAVIEAIRKKGRMMLTLYRYGSISKWWRIYFCGTMSRITIFYVVCMLVWLCTGDRNPNTKTYVLYYYLHIITVVALFLLLDMVTDKKWISVLLILLDGIGYVLSVHYGMHFLATGMYVRSEKCIDIGFSLEVTIVIKILLIVCCYCIFPYIWKWERDGRGCTLNGANN